MSGVCVTATQLPEKKSSRARGYGEGDRGGHQAIIFALSSDYTSKEDVDGAHETASYT